MTLASAEPREIGRATLRVLAWPGLAARRANPYTWLLYSHLAPHGVEVEEFTPQRALRGKYDLLHLHWPEKAMESAWPLPLRAAGAAAALTAVAAARHQGARVIWTAHNARPHDSRHPGLERRFWSALVRRVDGVIHPSEAGRRMVEARFPELVHRPNAVIPHGHFRGSYPDRVSRGEARAALGVPDGARVVAFVGLIRAYKNVPHLIRTVRALPRDRGEVVLLVAGGCRSAPLAEELRAAAAGDPRIRLAPGHVPEDRMQHYLRAADLVVLPFRDITNSGSALLALSFERPVLVPALGAMGEVRDLVGTEWVRTYEGELTPALLAGALEWAAGTRPGFPDLEALAWPRIAEQTLALYREASR